jgi:adenylate cyclase
LALRYRDAYYPSFALELARVYLGVPRERMALMLGQGVQFGTVLFPSDQKARMLINYAGGERSFSWVSATDVIHQRVPPGLFNDKVVLVGTSALGTYDQLTTPFSANFPGVEKNATVVENIIHGQFLHAGLWMGPLEVGLILLVGLTLTYCLPRLRALYGTVLTGGVVVGYATAAHAFFVVSDVCVPILSPLLTIVFVFTVTTVLSYTIRENQAKHLHDMFSSYVSPKIVEELIKSPWKAKLGGERKELSMLFADLAGFTTFSEKRPAEEVVAQLNEYLVAMTEVVFRWHGTLDKFVGDEIVVFWGAPLDQPDHVELAVKCALHMRDRLAHLHLKWRAEGKPLLDNGIGINTGMAVVGNIGAEGKKIDYTMIGDQVNLASRFQKLTRKAGCPILITEHTAERLKQLITAEDRGDNKGRLGHISLKRLGTVKLKGKEQLVGAYAIQSLTRGEDSRVDEDASAVSLEATDRLDVAEREAAA